MDSSPAFPWYPGDYLSSSRVQRMTLEQEGAYRRLLDYEWMDGYIPDDVPSLARLCRVTPRKMVAIWKAIKDCFVSLPECKTRLINLKLEKVREEKLAFRNDKSRAGHLGNLAKKEKQLREKEARTACQVRDANSTPSSSSSLKTISIQESPSSSSSSPLSKTDDDDVEVYEQKVLELYTQLPDTPAKPTAADRKTARLLRTSGIDTATVEYGLLLVSAKRRGNPALGPVVSLKYFLEEIKRVHEHPPPQGYREYLRGKVFEAEQREVPS
jgi:uncharacterized protein YdaU (DUF1376 family)